MTQSEKVVFLILDINMFVKQEDIIHRNIQKLKCDKCEFSCNRKTQFKKHLETQSENVVFLILDINQSGRLYAPKHTKTEMRQM